MLRNPEELLKQFLEANPLVKNHLGHTALDDFDHLCTYSGLSGQDGETLAWARYAYVSASRFWPATAAAPRA